MPLFVKQTTIPLQLLILQLRLTVFKLYTNHDEYND